MNRFDFSQLCECPNTETAIGIVFDAAHEKWELEGRGALTEGEITVLAVEAFFGEVLNGGFYQYFSNASGGLAEFGPVSLRRAGLHCYATILEPFLALFPRGVPSEDDNVRQTQVDAIADQYDEQFIEQMEQPFWDLYQQNPCEFREKLFAYIVANEGEFVQ